MSPISRRAAELLSGRMPRLALAIREGIRPDGTVIRPPMAIELYHHISDRDLAAVVAYLRSLPAITQTIPESTYKIPVPAS